MREHIQCTLGLPVMESKNNAVFGHASSDEFVSDAVFNPIIVNPDFVIISQNYKD